MAESRNHQTCNQLEINKVVPYNMYGGKKFLFFFFNLPIIVVVIIKGKPV